MLASCCGKMERAVGGRLASVVTMRRVASSSLKYQFRSGLKGGGTNPLLAKSRQASKKTDE